MALSEQVSISVTKGDMIDRFILNTLHKDSSLSYVDWLKATCCLIGSHFHTLVASAIFKGTKKGPGNGHK